MGETEILKEVLIMLDNGMQDCKCRKDRQILRQIKDYITSRIEVTENE